MANKLYLKNLNPAKNRLILAKLSRNASGGFLDIQTASKILELSPTITTAKLARLAKMGWLQRVKRGLYYILPIETNPNQPAITDDPWILANEVFAPCYIGGWSAAEHWGLTEQLFRSTLIITASNTRNREVNLAGHQFRLFQVPLDRISGTINVWRQNKQVTISDKERTIVDCLRNPELCGGVRHLAHMMEEYAQLPEQNFEGIVKHAEIVANGATWKRLGYLAELLWPQNKTIVEKAKRNLSSGIAKLDPAVARNGKLISKWKLWINVTISNNNISA